MKHSKLLTVCALATVIASCGTTEPEGTYGSAEVKLALTADGSHNFNVKSQAEETLPEINDFTVEIFKKSDGKRLYRDTYANSTDKKIRLNAGEYRLAAFHGDSLKAGFSAAFYQAKVPFSINASDRSVTVTGTAKLANVKVAVNYGDNLKEFYKEFVSSVSTDKKNVKDTLTFVMDETRAGFIPAGNLSFRLYAKIDGRWKVYKPEAVACSPNDFITFNVNTSAFEGKLTVGVKIDNATTSVEKEWTVDATDVATEAPEIKLGSSFKDGVLEFTEKESVENGLVSIQSRAGVKEAWLNISSDYLKGKGVPEKVDLLNIDQATKNILAAAGIVCLQMDSNTRFAGVDFSGASYKVKYSAADTFSGKYSVSVTDKNGNTATSDEFTVRIVRNQANVNITSDNLFAKSIRSFTVTPVKGDISKFQLQYRKAGAESWTNLTADETGDSALSYVKLGGLDAATTYEFRTIYNGNADNCSDVKTVTTPEAAQVGNNSFEDWTTETITISVKLSSSRTLDWYLPYANSADSWWAVTSKRSMPTSILATTKTSVKSFPTVAYSPEHSEGEKSAHLYTVNIGTFNTDLVASGTSYAGELFIGTADDSGNHASDGHAFTGRPDKISFNYKYAPKGSEKFYVKIELKDASGNVLFSKEDTEGPAASDWTKYSVDLDWSDLTKKPASIYICFKSSSSSSPAVTAATTLEVAGTTDTGGHFGSSLYVDDIELIYE